MVLDSSAIIAVLLQQPGWQQIQSRIELSKLVAVSDGKLLETHMVLTNHIGKDAFPLVEAFIQRAEAKINPCRSFYPLCKRPSQGRPQFRGLHLLCNGQAA